MAFVSRREIWKGRGGSQDDDNNNESDRVFVVTMDNSGDDEYVVALSYGGPSMFEQHPTRPGLWVDNIDIRNMDESAFLWIVNVHYSDKVEDPDNKKDSPLDIPMKDSWGHASYSLPAVEGWLFDENGIEATEKTALVSSANEAFDPPEERNASRVTIAVEFYSADVPTWILEYNDVLNSDSVTIRGITFPKYTLRINTRVSEISIQKGIPVRQVFYDLQGRKETFLKRIPDRGYNALVNGNSRPTKITINGMEPSQPVFLDGKGRQAGSALGTITATSSTLNLSSDTGEFEAVDVGQPITVQGAGSAGVDLVTTISAFATATQVTLADAASTSVSLYPVNWVVARQRFRVYRVDEALPFSILNLPP